MKRPLFCELCPLAFRISRLKGILLRKLKDALSRRRFSKSCTSTPLPVLIKSHSSPICRNLEGVDQELQQNKAVNLALAIEQINGVTIAPGETFSLWRLVGDTTAKKGYLPGLVIHRGKPTSGVGGGMCQLSNLLHWLALHSELSITEMHHHERFNLFPDDNRVVPFGLGTSIVYNYLDYRVTNNTAHSYQFLLRIEDGELKGELRCAAPQEHNYAIRLENDRFVQEADGVFRLGDIYRDVFTTTGELCHSELLRHNRALVMYELPTDALTE